MSILARGRKRRWLLLIGLLALAAGGTGLYFVQQHRQDVKAEDAGEAGVKAYQAGEFTGAIQGLGQYLGRFGDGPDTGERWYMYAKARAAVRQPNNRHLLSAIGSLRKALDRGAGDQPVLEALIDAYVAMNFDTEARAGVDRLLADNPGDPFGLKMRTVLLIRANEHADALESAREYCAAAPEDLEGYLVALSLMNKLGRSEDEIRGWVDDLHAERPDDRRLMVVKASAYQAIGDRTGASACLDEALLGPPLDAVFAQALVVELDRAERYGDALGVLQQIKADELSPEVRRELVRRLWFSRRHASVVERTAPLLPTVEAEEAELIALHVLSLVSLDRAEDAAAARKQLDRVVEGPQVAAWKTFLDRVVLVEARTPKQARDDCAAALALDPENPFVRQRLGDAYLALGEEERAVQAWIDVTRKAGTWALPLTRIAHVYLRSGREQLAVAPAKRAYLLDPSDSEALTTWIRAMVLNAELLDDAALGRLLQELSDFHEANPDEERTLPVYVALLAEHDPERATARLERVLNADAKPSERTLLRLAAAVGDAGLGLEEMCFQVSERAHGVTPPLAFARASFLARDGDAAAGRKVLEASRRRATDPDAPAWGIVWARYLDETQDAEATAAWTALVDAHPEDLNVQLAALASRAAWQDTDALDRTISRTRRLTGDDSLNWRVARARLTLIATDPPREDLEAATASLEDIVHASPTAVGPRLLLAAAKERLGDLAGAAEQLELAATLRPETSALTLELARMSQERGSMEEARSALDRFLRREPSTPADVRRAAVLLYRQGDAGRAVTLIEGVRRRRRLTREESLLLVRLYTRVGRIDRAVTHCERLLAEPDIATISTAASLYAARGRTEDALAVLERLEELDAPPELRLLARAEFHSTQDDPVRAKEYFRAALEVAPESQDVWLGFLNHCIRTGDVDEARASLGTAGTDGSSAVGYVRRNSADFLSALDEADLRPLLLALLNEPHSREPVLETLRLLLDAPEGRVEGEVLGRIRTLADGNPRVLPLQLLAIDLHVRAQDLEGALAVASRAVETFPNEPAPARSAAHLEAALGNWEEALERVGTWHERAAGQPRSADLLYAEILMRLDRAPEAVDVLAPHVDAARLRPAENLRLLVVYAWGLLLTNRHEAASDLLLPLSVTSSDWHRAWMSLDVSALGGASVAAQWLGVGAQLAAADDVVGQVILADAWRSLWRRTKEQRYLDTGERVLQRVLARKRDPRALQSLAMLYHESGVRPQAIEAYLGVIELDGKAVTARNNAAFLLAKEGDATQSVALAEELVRQVPESAEYRDTLAFCYQRAERPADAVASYRDAVRIDPENPQWHLALAETLLGAGDHPGLADAIARIDKLREDGRALTSEQRARLDALRTQLRDATGSQPK